MTPVDRDILEKKKAFILLELELLARLDGEGVSKESDVYQQYALCRSIQNALTAVIDIASHIVAEESNTTPSSYSQAIEELGVLGYLDATFASSFSRSAKLRNAVTHLYDKVDIDYLASLIPTIRGDLKTFLQQLDARL